MLQYLQHIDHLDPVPILENQRDPFQFSPIARIFQKITRDKRASLKAYAIDLVNIDSGEQFVIVFMPAKEFVSRQETTPLIE